MREISLDQLITRSEILLEKNRKNISFSSSLKNLIKKPRKNEFIPIQFEIIPETINDNMFEQGNLGTCYLVAAVNTIKQIPSTFINKEYDADISEYKFNIFINGILKNISLDDKFVYKQEKNDKLSYIGCQTYKYELFLKFIEKLYAEIVKERASITSNNTELEKSVIMLKNIIGGNSNYLYGCLLGTSCIKYTISDTDDLKKEKRDAKYIENIEKHINKHGVLITTSSSYSKFEKVYSHAYAIKSIYEYENKEGMKEKFVHIINPWCSGNEEKNFFDYEEIQKNSESFEYIHEINKKYIKTGKINVPLKLFSKWFKSVVVCEPKYGYHYKVIQNTIKEEQNHLYLFNNNNPQNVEIELFVDDLNNVEYNPNSHNIKLSLSKIEEKNINPIIETDQIRTKSFFWRKNAYIYIFK